MFQFSEGATAFLPRDRLSLMPFPLLEQLKEVFRRELEKAEQEVRRSSVIIADYKQV